MAKKSEQWVRVRTKVLVQEQGMKPDEAKLRALKEAGWEVPSEKEEPKKPAPKKKAGGK